MLANNSPSALRWENPKTMGVRRTVLFLGQSWSFSQHKSERQEWRNSSVRRAEQPERRQFGENSSSIPLTRRCALHVRTKALCGSGKGQPGPRGSEERSVRSSLVWDARTNQFSTTPLGHKPFPMAFGDNFDDAINHLYSGLIVNTRIKLVAFTTIILVGKRLVRPCPPG